MYHQCLAFANDLVIMTKTKQELIGAVKRREDGGQQSEPLYQPAKNKMHDLDERRLQKGAVSKYSSVITNTEKSIKLMRWNR